MSKTNLPMMIGSRYSRAKRRNGFISFISAISMIGIALGVWVLITVISIMNGFGNELRGRILDVTSHVLLPGRVAGCLIGNNSLIVLKLIQKSKRMLPIFIRKACLVSAEESRAR